MKDRRPPSTTVTESVTALKAQLSGEVIDEIKTMSLDVFRTSAHLGLGIKIRNTMLFVENSSLSAYLKSKGIFEQDDMSSLILTALNTCRCGIHTNIWQSV